MKEHATATAYPLSWPVGIARTPQSRRQAARFGRNERVMYQLGSGANSSYTKRRDRTVFESFRVLRGELARLGAASVVISTNVELKQNGEPYSGRRPPDDPGIAVYFTLKARPYAMPCDKWDAVADNLYAVAKHVEAMRGQLRWGVANVEQAFAGFKMLPAQSRSCYEILGVEPDADRETVQAAYVAKAKTLHPDAGGDGALMAELNAARDTALTAIP